MNPFPPLFVVRVLLSALVVSPIASVAQAPSKLSGNYDEAKVAPYTLPDPLVCLDGTPVNDTATWKARRRPEVQQIFETQMYGRVPRISQQPSFDVSSVDAHALGGKATRKLVKVWLLGRKDGPCMDLLIYLPQDAPKPVPAFLGLNFVGNQCVSDDPGVPVTTRWVRSIYTTDKSNHANESTRGTQASRWQVETVLARGFATATAYYGDLEEDHPEGWRNGIRGAVLAASGRTEFADDEWGAVAAWAWGLSRALDYLATDADIDASRVAVHGHSRLGKAALWAGAQDERFAAVISNNSGEGGASLMRRDFGETVAIANGWEPHRFCANFRRYNSAVSNLPVDSHLLIALATPRPIYIASATEDLLADPRGEFLAAHEAGAVYRLFGKAGIPGAEMPPPDHPAGDVVAYHLRTGKHDITAYDWARYLDFADKFLRRAQDSPAEQSRSTNPVRAGETPMPNAALNFEFPELPNTLAGMVSGTGKPARLSAILPANYSPTTKHPLFVYLKGGSGGPEDGGAMAREIVGAEDFIAVQMPLFKKNQPKGQTLPVMMEDLAVVSAAYRTMLERLAATVPNIDWERSVIGGHSNGAHTLSVLLAARDEFITQHFRAFWLHEGGFTLLPAALPMKDARFLVLVADDGMSGTSDFRQLMLDQVSLIERQAKLMKADLRSVIMRGYGHDVPPEYLRNVRQFARREPLEDIAATAKAQAAKIALPLRTHPESSAWNDLLIGDLTNMKVPGNIWSYRDGILTATADQNIWTKATHGDCVLDLEFKMEPGANSGVFLYNSDEKDWMPASVEIQICDDADPQWQAKPATWHCGAFFGHQAPTKSAVRAAGEWNRMTITAQGPHLTVVLNGEVVNEIDLRKFTEGQLNPDGSEVPAWMQGKPWSEMPSRGRIGFQGRHAGAGIEFRKVKLLRL